MHDLDTIKLRGLRQNNLKGFDLDLLKRSLIVVVGVSGSGKSSLVFDTIAAEAQRQLNATFSSYAQNYLPARARPDAARIENLSAAIVIDQRRLQGGPRSTLATVTDIGDWFRRLFASGATPSLGTPAAFSFNDPSGMCPRCNGLGLERVLDVEQFVDDTRSLREGPFRHPDYQPGKPAWRVLMNSGLFNPDVPVEHYSSRELHDLLYLTADEPGPREGLAKNYEGAVARFRRVELAKDPATFKGEAKVAYGRLVSTGPCSECLGSRLNESARTAQLQGMTLPELYNLQVADLAAVLGEWRVGPLDPLVNDIVSQLQRLVDLGLGYLHLARETATLSGGEAQRVKMVRHLGSTLNDVVYIFDEPTTGLHARDVDRLAAMLQALRDQGNTVIVVEHDTAIMQIADDIVEIGPGAGTHGGELIFHGTYAELSQASTPTGTVLRQPRANQTRRREPKGSIRIEGARAHNLKNVTVELPLGVLTVVTGVAGSGKSSLIRGHLPPLRPDAVLVDQAPIRGSRRSSTASWTGMLDHVRKYFAQRTGRPVAYFSPNSDGGCRACDGLGVTFVDVGFTEPITTVCETCQGRRFRRGVMQYQVEGLSIADVFEMTVEEAAGFFAADKKLSDLLTRIIQVGLGYLTLGQSLTTLSGGERQRLKLARHLIEGAQLIILDEPTTGLHPQDVGMLVALLHELVDGNRTVIVIEHDLDVIGAADHVIDIGPEGGHDGGELQYVGDVAGLARSDTHTGRYLASWWEQPAGASSLATVELEPRVTSGVGVLQRTGN